MNFDNNLVIDIVKSRTHEVLSDYFFSRASEERETVEFICTNMSYTFKLLLMLYFPHSTLLVNKFRVVKYINNQLNNTKIRIMHQYVNDKTSLEYRLLKNRYRLLLKNKEDLDILTLKKIKY